ncbi:hypothetical protein SDC9_116823 [bioreactor metagenome]|uniref:Glyoxalase-like domain-containing protein n=1 Tax=bioreactor metagenome TaxID=1076179 RepID=A0A645BX95_9ZZZZ|nr:VOC family protein [Lachnospiraceae bacterium]
MKNNNLQFEIGHLLIQVDNLESAIHQYRQMGFHVVQGGLPGKTHNALIYLKDGAFLELFSTNHGRIMNKLLGLMVKLVGIFDLAYSCRLSRYLPGNNGLRDYALDSILVSQYQNNLEKIRENGLVISKSHRKSRVDSRGICLKWTLSLPESVSLPFLMSEYQPAMKIEEKDVAHPNGVLGIKELNIATSQWDKTYLEYSLLLGIEPEITVMETSRSCLFPIQSASIHLMEKKKDNIESVVLYGGSKLESTEKHAAFPSFILLSS